MSNQPKSTPSQSKPIEKGPASLLSDLEAIRKSLDKIAASKPTIPTLEEIVGHRAPTTVNPENPFLSSSSLSDLIKVRNDDESRAAQELAELTPVKTIEQILKEAESPPTVPDPNVIIEQMETLFDSWIENTVDEYMKVFEGELRNRLQQDFRSLVTYWYKEHKINLPEGFARPKEDSKEDSSQTDSSEQPPNA